MGKKKQFQKPIELSDEEIFVDAEAELEKESIDRVIASRKQQLFKETETWYSPEDGIPHRLYLCARHSLDYNKPVGINSETCEVFNFDFGQRDGKTLPEYIQTLGCKWDNFINYDLAIEGNLKDYVLKY